LGKVIEMIVEILSAKVQRKSKVKPLRCKEKNKPRDVPTRTKRNPYTEVLLLEGARQQSSKDNNRGR
jgi:hypothetical protein